jgi:hypothetical protein
MSRLFPPPATLVLSVVCTMTAAGCGHGSMSSKELLEKYPTQIYSLTGEPLNGGVLGRPKCEAAQADWLARVDTDHDGTLEIDELLAETNRQFTVMNIDHSGQLTADQLEVYRAPFALTRDAAPGPQPDGSDQDRGQDRGDQDQDHDQGRRGGRDAPHAGTGPRPPASQPDPVLAADSNLDFEVSLQEFILQQRENFRQLDKNHDQRLSAGELNALCHMRERAAIR